MKAIITKYALTSGVRIVSGKHVGPGMFEAENNGFLKAVYYHGNDWKTTKESAVDDVALRAERLKKSLMKRLENIDKKKHQAIEAIEKMDLSS